jgi:hypothetical protein
MSSQRAQESVKPEAQALAQMLEALSTAPKIFSMLEEQGRQLQALREEVRKKAEAPAEPSGWLDAKAAAAYLDMSATTFDKYRYQSPVRIKGYKVGGKLLYQRKDLDSFVKLYEINSAA